IGIAAQQGAGKNHNAVGAGGQGSESVALRCITRQLMNFIADAVIKPVRQVSTDELHGSHAADLLPVRLPKRAIQESPRLRALVAIFFPVAPDYLAETHLGEVGDEQAVL